MEVIETHYIEKIYNHSQCAADDGVEICRVDSRDPLMVAEEKDLVGFRFFDVGEGIYKSGRRINLFSPQNYSGMYYFGERVSYRDLFLQLEEDPVKKLQLDCLNRLNVEEAIFCEKAGKVISCINAEDRTISEVKIERISEQANTIFISQSQFMSGIVRSLEARNRMVDIIASETVCPLCDVETVASINSANSIIRTYDLYVDGYIALSSSSIVNGDKIGCLEKDTFFKLSDAEATIKPLYQEYPYLEVAMRDLKLALANGNVNVEEALTSNIKIKTK